MGIREITDVLKYAKKKSYFQFNGSLKFKLNSAKTPTTQKKISAKNQENQKMSEIQEVSSTDEEELDMTSEKFNPLKALYSTKVKLPVNRRKFDNLSSFISQIKKAGGSLDADLDSITQKKKDQQQEADDGKYHVTAAGRRFLKEQGE